MTERPRQFRPTFEIEGPESDPLVVPWWVLLIVFVLVCFATGAVMRAYGVL